MWRSVAKSASELRVNFNKESPVPDRSWRLRPYLGYDWIAGSLDNNSPISSKPEAFFSKLQEFRETNKKECIHSEPAPSSQAGGRATVPRKTTNVSHCLLSWVILPPKPEKSSGPQSLDLWSCVTSEAQHQQLSASPSHLAQSVQVPSPTPIWSEPQAPQPRPCTLVDNLRTGHLEDSAPAIASSLFPLAGVPMRGEPCPASARGGLRLHPPRWGRW
ncbi:migration and invasion-inhibitory protein-like [Myotis yumanensis]|uniref:migration and invasion-inhibitory protein-like n=1 Tax=Myotis yumanensis TaxID=159337 RepID=UPI0038CF615F